MTTSRFRLSPDARAVLHARRIPLAALEYLLAYGEAEMEPGRPGVRYIALGDATFARLAACEGREVAAALSQYRGLTAKLAANGELLAVAA